MTTELCRDRRSGGWSVHAGSLIIVSGTPEISPDGIVGFAMWGAFLDRRDLQCLQMSIAALPRILSWAPIGGGGGAPEDSYLRPEGVSDMVCRLD